MTLCLCLACLFSPVSPAAADAPAAELRKATSLEIGYTVNDKPKSVTVTDAKKLNEILSTLTIQGTDKDLRVGLYPSCRLKFTLPDKSVVQALFVRPDHLEADHWGQVYLKDTKFHQKVNEIASNAEGKPIDVLENN